jgi:uncharacterized lipoprotein YddW (UPF0748 family)
MNRCFGTRAVWFHNLQRKCAHSPFRNVKLGDNVEAIGRNTVLLHVARPEKGPRDIKGVGI